MPVDVHKVRHGYLLGAGPGDVLSRAVDRATAMAAAVYQYRPDTTALRSIGQRVMRLRRPAQPSADPVIDAMSFLARTAGTETVGGGVDFKRLVKRARAAAHPDRNRGQTELWLEVERAREIVQAHSRQM